MGAVHTIDRNRSEGGNVIICDSVNKRINSGGVRGSVRFGIVFLGSKKKQIEKVCTGRA